MKYIKKYETIQDDPKVDDYVLCEERTTDDDVRSYIETHVGQIIEIEDKLKTIYNYKVFYKNSNRYFGNNGNCRSMDRDEIIYFSENIEDVKAYLKIKNTANKFNI
jgi:asparagine N-glycosylation enzyme membrane subunit Stt3